VPGPCDEALDRGLYVLPSGMDGVRAIPYLNISTAQVQEAIGIIASVANEHALQAGSLCDRPVARGAGY
jgi:threonine aldolase